MSRTDLRVLTVNLLAPAHADWARRRPLLRDGIAALNPDLVALQEVVDPADVLGPGYHVAHHPGPSDDGVGAALASRWPLGEVRHLDLHVTERVDLPWSAAVAAEIDTPLGPLLFVHHKPTYHVGYAYERERQAVACARFVEDLAGGADRHVILAGDFDDTPDSASVRFWTGRQSLDGVSVAYRDVWDTMHPDDPGHTFTPVNPLVRAGEMALETGRRIDYVLVRCGIHGPTLEITDCRRVFDRPVDGVWPTDHFGVLADLRAPAHPPGAWA